ncbi:MAG: 2-amino-3,7-dideoxy-D-threo-hept-6-ulosonate synthase [Desulfovibrionaceae bacterium]|nr:2-amino-3,7-dideoxy-D-threo-hept-6-ulosonate synthase [Desulfovibrionaceae bacterium]
MYLGKKIRLERIVKRNNGRTIIVPMDHGVSMGRVEGLINMRETVSDLAEGGADAVLMHKGLVRCGYRSTGTDVGLIIHLSASTELSPNPNRKTLVGTVEEAIKHGADAVSIHINIGAENEAEMLADAGHIAGVCDDWGMPLLTMVYARGPKIENSYDPKLIAHCARIGVELGADIVKIAYTGEIESFSRAIEGSSVPVVIAGGPRMNSTRDVLQMVHDSLLAGGAGISIGRNVFQHPNRPALVRALRALVHENADVEHAMQIVGE